jgi:hypothetical protein
VPIDALEGNSMATVNTLQLPTKYTSDPISSSARKSPRKARKRDADDSVRLSAAALALLEEEDDETVAELVAVLRINA